MTGTVSMNLFSGLPNPSWSLDESAADRLNRILIKLPRSRPTPTPKAVDAGEVDVLTRPLAGFRGFEVALGDDGGGRRRFETFNGLILDLNTRDLLQDVGASFDEQLYATAPPAVLQGLGNMTFAQLKTAGAETPIAGLEGADHRISCAASPPYTGDTGPWKTFRDDNNCYNYATVKLNDMGDPVAVPGPGDHLASITLTESALKNALQLDALALTGNSLPSSCPLDGTHVLVVMLRHHPTGLVRDFHCVRLDNNGAWSHKDGKGKVRNLDDAHQPIVDLTAAKFSWSPTLVGVYVADYAKRSLID